MISKQRNGPPKRSILVPILFNINTNNQLSHPGARNVTYANDLYTTAQAKNFTQVEAMRASVVNGLLDYYIKNQLNATLNKTQDSLFHIQNQDTSKQLNLTWN